MIVGGSVLLFTPLPHHHGFLNSDMQVSEAFACRSQILRQSPLDEERTAGVWVGMSAADPSVTASQFVVVGGFLPRSLSSSPLHPLLLRRDKIYGEQGGETPHGLGFSLSGSPAPSAALGGEEVTLARMWITVVTDTVVVS